MTRRFAVSRNSFAIVAFLLELVSIVAIAMLTGLGYHYAYYREHGLLETYAAVGSLTGLAYCLTFLIRDEYRVETLLEGRRGVGRLFLVWSLAFVGLGVIGFLTKSTAMFSRVWMVIFYVVGFMTVIAINTALNRGLAELFARGLIRRRRLMIVGGAAELARMEREIEDGGAGVIITARVALATDTPNASEAKDILEKAVDNGRALGVQDIIISNALSNSEFLERCVTAFSVLPVAIHVGAGGLAGRFKHASVVRFGRTATLSLSREPIGRFEAILKRALDIVLAGVALLLLSPLFALVAFCIKRDSPGPVFFRQRRRGFNLEEFAIWKFRTMTTQEDGDTVLQATANDRRVTPIGKILRSYSLDELPQLINVLKGEMSLVGPRPHAVAHDRFFEKRIAMYPRRLNMKPGITGWAQVNGFRGATQTDDAMRNRVEHDLYYIDNWSIALDIYILLLTVISRKASHNAY